jgi:hypothetical protein
MFKISYKFKVKIDNLIIIRKLFLNILHRKPAKIQSDLGLNSLL